MPGHLREELKQKIPFASREEETLIAIMRTADLLQYRLQALFKRFDLTLTQYNVLRILRGAGPPGLSCREVGRRLINQVPDVTRLLDRMEGEQLVRRERQAEDRRIVRVTITPRGLKLAEKLHEPLAQLERAALGHISQGRLEMLCGLLEEARSAPEN